MDFDQHTLRVLEYSTVIEMLVERTSFSLGAERARDLLPTPLWAFVKERQQETREARFIRAGFGEFPLGGIHDLRPLLVRAEVGQTLAPTALLDIASTLIGASRLKAFLQRHLDKAPLLVDRSKAIEEFPQLVSEIDLCIERSGEVSDAASSALASIRNQVRIIARRIDERLNQILNAHRSALQDAHIVLRDDRRCLPVRAENRREIKGIVHDQSASGATLFIEPMVVVELNNELRSLEAKERHEVEKVLAKLTASVARQGERIHGTVDVVAGIDVAHAKAKLAEEMQAMEPAFNRNGFIRLREARHPLLNQDTVVPLNMTLGDKFKVMLITGPNTGGKTVGIKTVGLLTLMAQAGLQVPAATGTELAHFEQIFADIGDEQSIQQSLSTFSAHITNIVRILKSVGKRALVLMDEMGAGTDPAEGAALAKAILSYLLQHNARVISTTHYGELKEFAYSRDGIENAAVEFDPETLRPTYRLLQGVPGSSNAFHIARRLGMANSIVDEAIQNQNRADADITTVMQRLEKAKRTADEERRRAERLSKEMDALKEKYEERLRDLELLRREAKQRAAEEARQVIRQKTEKMENILTELRRIGKEGRKTNSARKKMKDTADEMIGGIGYENEPLPVDETDIPKGLRKGDTVRVLSLGGTKGEVLEDSNASEALVQIGMMRVTVPLSSLRPENRSSQPAPAPKRVTSSGVSALALEKAMTISPEVVLIAQRVDAALPRLDKYLDDAFAAGLPGVRVIHGKGSGQMRKAVWEFLKEDTRIASFALAHPDEGGAGATVVRFAE